MAKSVRVDITARDNGSRVVKGFVDKSSSEFNKLGRSISGITKSMLGWTAAIAGAATAATALTKKVFEQADHIAKLADSIGMSTAALQKYQFAAKIAGVESAQLEMSMRYLVKGIFDSRSGVGTLITSLKDNQGLIKKLQDAKSVSEQLSIALDAVSKSSDHSGISMALFGSRAGLAMVNLARSYKESIALAEKYGLVIDEKLLRGAEKANDAMTLLWTMLKTKLYEIILRLGPAIMKISTAIADWLAKNKDILDQKLDEVFTKIGNAAEFMANNIDLITTALKNVGSALNPLKGTYYLFKDLYKKYGLGEKQPVKTSGNENGPVDVWSPNNNQPLKVNVGGPNKELSERLSKMAEIRAEGIAKQFRDAEYKIRKEYEQQQEIANRAALMKIQGSKAKAYMDYRNTVTSAQYGAALHPSTGSAEDILRSELPQGGTRDELMNRIGGAEIDAALKKSLDKSKTYSDNFLKQQAEAAKKFKETWGGVASNFVSNFQDAFVSVANGTKKIGTAFKDLALSVIEDIERMIAKMLIMQAISGAAKAFGFGDIFGGANGGIAQGGFKPLASGGVVTQPTLGLIGEGSMNEAVVPLPDGRSIPVKGNTGGHNITNNINVTVDSRQGGDPEKSKKLAKDIADSIDQKIKETLTTELRPGGILNRQHYARAY